MLWRLYECCFPGVGKPESIVSYVGLLDVQYGLVGWGQDLSPCSDFRLLSHLHLCRLGFYLNLMFIGILGS